MITYPVFVVDQNSEAVRFDSEADLLGQLEAIDVEEGEYDAWDSTGQALELKAYGVGTWNAGTFGIFPTGNAGDLEKFERVRASARLYRR